MWRRVAIVLFACATLVAAPARADDVSAAQRRAALELLNAVASGDAQALTDAVHPDERDRVRAALLVKLRDEATRNDDTLRGRFFGTARPLAEIERLTSADFCTVLLKRTFWRGRPFEDVKGLAAVRDGDLVHVLVKGRQPKDRGKTEVLASVTLLPYGKEWKAAWPSEIAAQLEDLESNRGRTIAQAAANAAANGTNNVGGSSAGSASAPTAPRSTAKNPPGVLALLDAAEKALIDNRCDTYYREYLSPNFRKTQSSRILDTLIASCRRSIANRELLIAALRIVRPAAPNFEAGGTRAVYDVSGQGLPFDRFALEQVGERWYVAE
jgi:hypothetical protein